MSVIAVLGGSFDPIHNGHLHIARQILAAGAADRVAFVPNNRHNFKGESVVLPFTKRHDLIALVLEPGMELWGDDASGSGFTSDLLRRLYLKHPEDRLLFAIGSDNLASLTRWHEYAWLRDHAEFLILPRPEYPMPEEVLGQIKAHVLRIELSSVSSTDIRNRILAGLSIAGLVPEAIQIRVTRLYREALSR